MNRILIALGLSAGLAAMPLMAQTAAAIPDTDGNGMWSMEELKAGYPDLTEETFAAMDTTGDGQIDQAEFDAAVTAGLLKS